MTTDEPLSFVVQDSFQLIGRGIVLAPSFATDRFPHGTRLSVSILGSSGATRTVKGQFFIEHARLRDGGSQWSGVVLLDEGAGKIEPGDRVSCQRVPA